MDGTLDAAPLPCPGPGAGVIGAAELSNISVFILYDLLALDYIGVFETHFPVRLESEELLGRILHEVSPLDVQLTGERNLTACSLGLCRIERAVKPLDLALGIVGNRKLHRVLNHHIPVAAGVQILPYAPLKQLDINQLVPLGHAYLVAEHLKALGSIASPPDSAQRRHPGIVPA